MSFLDSIKNAFKKKDDQAIYLSGFKKTSDSLGAKLFGLKKQYNGVDEAFLEELTIVLLESDVGITTADLICERLKKRAEEYPKLPFDWAMDILVELMAEIYNETENVPIVMNENGTTVIFLVGVNGSGKTTTCAKLIDYYKTQGKSVAVAAADTFRAGAVAQLEEWANRLGVPCIKGKENGDPSAVLVDACRFAKENNIDILLCDTAGRLQNKISLMNELAKMHKVTGREIENAPHNVWLVLDATTGQNGLAQAEIFDNATHLTGIILTKMDGTAKGGIILAIKNKLKLPVLFIGLGERQEDLRPFDLNSYLASISEGMENAR
ncbi:MAG: signal recognition particle-docking protein FtsY [Erysipelotrichaceae bacterium]|nr:signal recognition particle-docking protein FtsY [Erysipelotrichaceae bacterium]